MKVVRTHSLDERKDQKDQKKKPPDVVIFGDIVPLKLDPGEAADPFMAAKAKQPDGLPSLTAQPRPRPEMPVNRLVATILVFACCTSARGFPAFSADCRARSSSAPCAARIFFSRLSRRCSSAGNSSPRRSTP